MYPARFHVLQPREPEPSWRPGVGDRVGGRARRLPLRAGQAGALVAACLRQPARTGQSCRRRIGSSTRAARRSTLGTSVSPVSGASGSDHQRRVRPRRPRHRTGTGSRHVSRLHHADTPRSVGPVAAAKFHRLMPTDPGAPQRGLCPDHPCRNSNYEAPLPNAPPRANLATVAKDWQIFRKLFQMWRRLGANLTPIPGSAGQLLTSAVYACVIADDSPQRCSLIRSEPTWHDPDAASRAGRPARPGFQHSAPVRSVGQSHCPEYCPKTGPTVLHTSDQSCPVGFTATIPSGHGQGRLH